jgi:hypothetical protein
MDRQSFTTRSGKKVHLRQLHIRVSTLGFLEGRPEMIRSVVLGRLPGEIVKTYGQYTGFLVLDPLDGPLPEYTFLASLGSYAPIQPEADFSSMVIVWFANTLPANLPEHLQAQLNDVDWERYAMDGEY